MHVKEGFIYVIKTFICVEEIIAYSHICERDRYVCERDLNICERDLDVCERDRYICDKDLHMCGRDYCILAYM